MVSSCFPVPNGQSLVRFDRPMACLLKQTPSAVPTASLRTSVGGGIGWNDVSTNCLVLAAGCCNCRKIHWQTQSSTYLKGALRWLFPVSTIHIYISSISRFYEIRCFWWSLLLIHTTTSTCGEFGRGEYQFWNKCLSLSIHLSSITSPSASPSNPWPRSASRWAPALPGARTPAWRIPRPRCKTPHPQMSQGTSTPKGSKLGPRKSPHGLQIT